MHIKFNCTDVKDVDVEHEGKTLRLNQGLVRITFDGYVVSDRKHYWSKKPFYWFLSVLSQKYFFSDHFAKLEDWIKSDVDDLHTKIKNYLNVFKYTYRP